MSDCYKPLYNGTCCCNCVHQKKLMCHPWNQKFGKGGISTQCGWVCTVMFESGGDGGEYIFFDKGHGFCELHTPKEVL